MPKDVAVRVDDVIRELADLQHEPEIQTLVHRRLYCEHAIKMLQRLFSELVTDSEQDYVTGEEIEHENDDTPAIIQTLDLESPSSTPTRLLSVRETAKRLKVSEWRMYDLIRQKLIPVVRMGRTVRISEDALTEWIAQGGQALPGGWRRAVSDDDEREREEAITETRLRDSAPTYAEGVRATTGRGHMHVCPTCYGRWRHVDVTCREMTKLECLNDDHADASR